MSRRCDQNIIPKIAVLLHWGAAISFVVYVLLEFLGLKSSQTIIALALVALLEIIAVAFDQKCHRIDEATNKAMLEEIEATKMVAEKTANKLAPRHLSDATKEVWKKSLSTYTGQPFRIVQVGCDDKEAQDFAIEIHRIVADCGWIGNTTFNFDSNNDDIRIHSGIDILVNAKDGDNWLKSGAAAASDLIKAIDEAGIYRSMRGKIKTSIVEHIFPAGTVGIIVGPKN